MAPKRTALEVKSGSIEAELVEIKERLGSLETIASLSNSKVVAEYARNYLTSPQRLSLMGHCEAEQTKEQLKVAMNLNSTNAVDIHLKPLREADLIHQRQNDDGLLEFEWSKLFKSLPKASRNALLGRKSK
jgi:hypothetical protein